jgi:hypothetical protein
MKSKKLTKQCLQCNEPFLLKIPSDAKRRKFCTFQCSVLYTTGRKLQRKSPKKICTKICVFCNKEYILRGPKEIETRVHCSKQCQHDALIVDKIGFNCKICGKFLEKAPSHVTEYCSRKCKGIASRKIPDLDKRQCIICKVIKDLEYFSLYNGYLEYRCKDCFTKRGKAINRSIEGRFGASKKSAKYRNLEWSISKEDYFDLIKNNCNYCGGKLNETGCGLDRKDSSKGYLIDNVVPCCERCNYAKNAMTMEEFRIHVKRMFYTFAKKGKEVC